MQIKVNDPFGSKYNLYELEANFKIWRLARGFELNFNGAVKSRDEESLSAKIGAEWTTGKDKSKLSLLLP